MEAAFNIIDGHGKVDPQLGGNQTPTKSTAHNAAVLDLWFLEIFQKLRDSLEDTQDSENLHVWIANSTSFFSSNKSVNDEQIRKCLDPHAVAHLEVLQGSNAFSAAAAGKQDRNEKTENVNTTSAFLDSIERQECMQKPYSTIHGHIEILVQFGIIAMFAPVFPLGPLLALINNLLEIRMEVSGAVDHTQRFCSYGTKEPDIFLGLLTFMSALSVMISCAVILLQTDLLKTFDGLYSESEDESVEDFDDIGADSTSYEASHVIVLVVIEHIVLAIKLLLFVVLPDIPEWVELAEVAGAREDIASEDDDDDNE